MIQYGTFTNDSGTHSLYLDEYTPPVDQAPHEAVISVHGGGWIGGCRRWNDGLSRRLAQQGYIVFNIDYRLSCPALMPVYLCGAHYPSPITDVETAIVWARAHADEYGVPFSETVIAVGTSAGGNLSFMAAMTGTAGTTRPDAVAGASGPSEMGYMSDGETACSEAFTEDDKIICDHNQSSYFGYELEGDGTRCQDNWAVGSPTCNLPEVPVPVFIANALEELVAYQGALDYLGDLEFKGTPVSLCSVSGAFIHAHGTELFAEEARCIEAPYSNPFTTMVDFLKANT